MTCQSIRLWIAVKKLNYTNHSSSTLEMGTEAFLDNRDLRACELSPAMSAAHAVTSVHKGTSSKIKCSCPIATCPLPGVFYTLSHHCHLLICRSHLPAVFKLVFDIRDLSSRDLFFLHSVNAMRKGRRASA